MSLKRFHRSDVITNTIKAYPQSEFTIFDGVVYYNQIPVQTGSRNRATWPHKSEGVPRNVRNVQNGYLSLYEYNIDRPYRAPVATETQDSYLFPWDIPEEGEVDTRIPSTGRIFPWISKQSAGASWKTVGQTSYNNEFAFGDILIGSYPLSASITREYTSSAFTNNELYNAHFVSLRNKLNYYGAMSKYYLVSSSAGDLNGGFKSGSVNGTNNPVNFLFIPSIFYGTKVKPGSVSLKWFYTGSLIGELRDENQNGELIQVGPIGSVQSGNVAGVIMYNEGVVMLTGSWDLTSNALYGPTRTITVPNKSPYPGSGGGTASPSWIRYGAGANDGWSDAGGSYGNASFNLNFKGQTETQVVTMFAHARKGEINYSNNPTFLEYGQEKIFMTSSTIYQESSDQKLKNFVSSSYVLYDAPFKRQVIISQVAIYDSNRNLIGVATLGDPVVKEDDQAYTFKMKIDI